MLPVYQVAAGGDITEGELPGSIVHFPQHCQEPPSLTSHLSFLVASSRATADSELWRTLRRFSTGSGNEYDLRTVLECAHKPRGGSREDGDLRVD